jgi:hypothetical protein
LLSAEQLQRQALSDQARCTAWACIAATHRFVGIAVAAVRYARAVRAAAGVTGGDRGAVTGGLALTLEADGESRTHIESALGVGSELSDEDGHVTHA